MRSAEEFDDVRRLIAAGMNDCAIARTTGIPRKTVWQWRCRPAVRKPTTGGFFGLRCRPRLRRTSGSAVRIPVGALPRRRLYLARTPDLPPADHMRHKVSGDYCQMSRSDRRVVSPATRGTRTACHTMRGCFALLKPLAMPVPATRTPPQAPPANPPGTMATGTRRSGHRGVRLRSDPQRRLPRRRQ